MLSSRDEQLVALTARAASLESDLVEAGKQIEAQHAELERYRDQLERQRPNQPERVPTEQLQLAFERVVNTLINVLPANDALADAAGAEGESESAPRPPPKRRRRSGHGRRNLNLTNLPVERVEVDPEQVLACGGEGWRRIGEETSERLAFRPASYIRLLLVRGKWVRTDQRGPMSEALGESPPSETQRGPVFIAPVPDSMWSRVMGDPSAVANIIVSKYGDVLPLNRQETISWRQGFALPRSTQCQWLRHGYEVTYRVVDAMLGEARARAFCIATDSTGVRVRASGGSDNWGMFVFIADRDHVVFRHARAQDGDAVRKQLSGYHGHLLADASAIFDAVYRPPHNMTEVACWFHCRRYFWRSVESDREAALEALAIIAKLFEVARQCQEVAMPERTAVRAARASPILELFDVWIERHRDKADPRGPLDAAIGYYTNQRDALRRFLDDGRLRLDNNISEAQLRNVVLGLHNWKWFANETGLKWYATFRSLIASCALHGLNTQSYLEQLLRLAPHWPLSRQLELSPKYWARTVAGLDDSARAIIAPPWARHLAVHLPSPTATAAAA
jgi:transposase